MTDLIRKSDALAALDWGDIYGRNAQQAISALPAVTVGVKPLGADGVKIHPQDILIAAWRDDLGEEGLAMYDRILAALEPAAPDETTKNRRAYKVGVAVGKASAEARAERLEAAMVQMRDDRTGFRHAVHFRRFIAAALTPTAVDASQPADPAVNAPDPACDHCGMDPAAIREAALEEAALEQALSNFRATLRTMPESKNLIDDLIPKGAAE